MLVASARFRKIWDVSITRSNSLSQQSLEVLAGLQYDVEIIPLYTRQDEIRREAYGQLLDRYRRASDRIRVEFVDPVERPGRVRDLGLDPQEQDLAQGLTLVRRDATRSLTFTGLEEEAVTNALLEVGRTGDRVVGVLRGYGERDIRSEAGGGFAELAQALAQEYYEVIDVDLQNGIPDEVTVVLAPGPTQRIPDEHLAVLQTWLEGGGRLLALLDPGEATGLNAVLGQWGLRATGLQIVDPRQNVNNAPSFIRTEDYSSHPLVKGFGKRLPTAFAVAGIVVHFETGEGSLLHDDLVRSSGFSSALEEDGTTRAGPFATAAASWLKRTDGDREIETRIVLVGDSDFASNAYLAAHANRNFVLNAMGWLSRETQLVSIRRARLAGQVLEFTQAQGYAIFWLIASPPLLILAAGVVVALRRRGR